jgi:hypothetical protein
MIITERIYREGFLDGMRYSGRLIEDVADEDLVLNPVCVADIAKYFNKRHYFEEGSSDMEKFHTFMRNMVLDVNRLYDENIELKRLLAIANNDKSEYLDAIQ